MHIYSNLHLHFNNENTGWIIYSIIRLFDPCQWYLPYIWYAVKNKINDDIKYLFGQFNFCKWARNFEILPIAQNIYSWSKPSWTMATVGPFRIYKPWKYRFPRLWWHNYQWWFNTYRQSFKYLICQSWVRNFWNFTVPSKDNSAETFFVLRSKS